MILDSKIILKIFREGINGRNDNLNLKDCKYKPDSIYEFIWLRGWQYQNRKILLEEYIDDEIYENIDDFYLNYGWIRYDLTEAIYNGRKVILNKPMRGDRKRFKVYVNSGKKTEKGEIIAKKIEFGSLKGSKLRVRNYDLKKSKKFCCWA